MYSETESHLARADKLRDYTPSGGPTVLKLYPVAKGRFFYTEKLIFPF